MELITRSLPRQPDLARMGGAMENRREDRTFLGKGSFQTRQELAKERSVWI